MSTAVSSPQSRKVLYKQKGPWLTFGFREALKRRCRERLKEDRYRTLQKYRTSVEQNESSKATSEMKYSTADVVENVVVSQWRGMQDSFSDILPCDVLFKHRKRKRDLSSRGLCSHQDYLNALDDTPPDVDDMVSLFEELTKELIQEEEDILKQYEKSEQFSEESLCAAIESLSAEDVICPLCQKDVLHQSHMVIFCSCGFRIDTGFGGVTLKYMKKQLEEGCTEHDQSCSLRPTFVLDKTAGVDNLLMRCEACAFLYVVV